MIDLYYWTTPNGHKITLFLEETGLPYAHPSDQHQPGRPVPGGFPEGVAEQQDSRHRRSPTGRRRRSLSLFESGAILLYLAEKTGRFLAKDLRARQETLQWLFWQMGGLGPMAGQNHHFNRFAPEKIPYAIDRYVKETARLYGVLDQRLADRAFVAGDDYSIADMAIYPWIVPHQWQEQDLADFPHLQRWFESIRQRPATQRAYALVERINPPK